MIYTPTTENPAVADVTSGISMRTRTEGSVRGVEREEIKIGDSYVFYSSWAGFAPKPGEAGQQQAMYTGQSVRVIERMDWDAETAWGQADGLERGVLVEAEDGHRFPAYLGELDGWYRDTLQFAASVEWFEAQGAQRRLGY
jgi:hypothetical protein